MLECHEYETALDDFFAHTGKAEDEITEVTFGRKRYLHLYEDDSRGHLQVKWVILRQDEMQLFQSVEARHSQHNWPAAFYIEIRPLSVEDRERVMNEDIEIHQLLSWSHIKEEMKADLVRQYDERKGAKSNGREHKDSLDLN